ncbi:LysR family transcriptional regulator [Bordetella genomosp. 1]|uniref:LysR family transcriptional regulator n=1 Tax=Bordetella genomosp. 1 TaxID=1395607 RepID=A0A261RW62_9BORD|nr:LysR family transcriptional regulator [Bordetella genomosp. 1]MDQ8031124.1 LysR family transcriptional regulator [Bordetella sp.]OZI29294.1 LysR family transcriptional regulator [Bordetella genomosp. 1]OZI64976.1 hypothetical protein CAL27_07795 [Bordetella genomosp. 1]
MAHTDSAFNLNDIAIFVEVAKRLNISRTAELIGVPATTVSRRLRVLESRLGVELLSRNTRSIALTEAGKLYYDRCRMLVEQAIDAQDVLLDEGIRPRGTLKVMLPDPLDGIGFVAMASAFARSWPELRLRCDYAHDRGWEGAREFDVALRWGTQADSDLIARRIGFFPFRLYASPAYLSQHGRPARPEELETHQCLIATQCRELAAWVLERDGRRMTLDPQGRLHAHDLEMTRRFAAAGMGIAALPADDPRNDALVPVLDDWTLAPIALYAMFGSRTPPARARAFVDALIAHTRNDVAPALPRLADTNVGMPSRAGQQRESRMQAWTA